MPDLPIIAITPAKDGGLLALSMPQRQDDHWRITDPGDEYRNTARLAIDALADRLRMADPNFPPLDHLELVFVEPVNNPPGPVVGYQGFYADGNRIFIVVPWTPLEELPWLVRHETGHALYFWAFGDDGCLPHENGPSEQFAHMIAGPDPHPERHVGGAQVRALFEAASGATQAFVEPPAQPVALPARAKLRKVRGLLAKAESTDSVPEASALVSKALELVDGLSGSITVKNPGSIVIIDGTSNMFKICSSGTLSSATGPNATAMDLVVDLSTNLTSPPAHQSYAGFMFGQLPYLNIAVSVGANLTFSDAIVLHTSVVSTNRTRVTARNYSGFNRTPNGWSVHYFIFKEAAI